MGNIITARDGQALQVKGAAPGCASRMVCAATSISTPSMMVH